MGLTKALKLVKIENVSSQDISEWKNYFKKNVHTTIAHSFSLGLILQKTYGYSFEPYKILKNNKDLSHFVELIKNLYQCHTSLMEVS
jgi:hypothetical protein